MKYAGRPHGGEGRGPSDEDGLSARNIFELWAGTVVYARLCMVQYCRYQYSAHIDIVYGSR